MEILIRILFGFFGIFLYALLTARDKSEDSIQSVTDYFKTQYVKWAISFLIIIVISVMLYFAPDAGEAFEGVTALKVTTNVISFMWLGYTMSSAGKKIGN